MSLADKKKFLLFLTGSYRIPIQGMKGIKVSLDVYLALFQKSVLFNSCFYLNIHQIITIFIFFSNWISTGEFLKKTLS